MLYKNLDFFYQKFRYANNELKTAIITAMGKKIFQELLMINDNDIDLLKLQILPDLSINTLLVYINALIGEDQSKFTDKQRAILEYANRNHTPTKGKGKGKRMKKGNGRK